MKYLSLKILFLCILLPPILYTLTLQSLEKQFQKKVAEDIEKIYLGDTQPLFNGSIRLKEAIGQNISLYLRENTLVSLGMKVMITVTTKGGTIVYPAVFEEPDTSLTRAETMEVASQNYLLMNEGLLINVDVNLEHNTLISNVILSVYIMLFLLVLYAYYMSGLKKTRQEDLAKISQIENLRSQEKAYTEKLEAIERDRTSLTSKFEGLKREIESEKSRFNKNEEEMIEEIVVLEEEIEKNLSRQKEQEALIEDLKEKIKQFESEKQKEDRQKVRAGDSTRKRFSALYKNIVINDRAISGFVDLPDEMKIKAEEIIHQLNENPKMVQIKRKVFSKKGKETVLEVLFAYKGRLYFRNIRENKIEVLVVGSKNTQTRDLEFLDSF